MYMMNSVLFYNDEGKCMYELMEKRPKTTKAVFDRLHTHTHLYFSNIIITLSRKHNPLETRKKKTLKNENRKV